MPVLLPRQEQRGSETNTLSPLRIAGIVIVIIAILLFTGLVIFRHRRRKQRAAEFSRRSKHFVNSASSRPHQDPTLPPYEPPRGDYEMQQQQGYVEGSGASTPSLRMPPPARLNTPPGYGAHVADRPAGPLSDAPPAYHEQDRVTWGRSGCVR